ncbi:ParB/RepB/Spo0J family partition protein [Planctomicrobium sp. SH668]|uniref:ParB/RepB/Spo0J family partition protein n=1 Tax=Planctomicrobium sp. SH668 TaxID=3448126 RepID=UPI003F5B25D0
MSENVPVIPQRRLGRGLNALLGGGAPAHEETQQEIQGELREIPTSQLSRNPFQPRKHFDPESIGELASSVKEHGVLQPILVRAIENGFQIIAGERRWQASQKAGLKSIPCRVVDVIDKTACEYALEENLKRKDLNDLEKGQAFKDYIEQFQCTVEELAKQLSMKRSTISNMMRLLELPDPIKNAINSGRLTAGHARALLPLDQANQLALSGRIQAEQLSVRQTEAIVKSLMGRDVEVAQPATAVDVPVMAESATVSPSMPDAMPAAIEVEVPAQATVSASPVPPAESKSERDILQMREVDQNRTNHVESLESQLRDLLGVRVEIKLSSKESGQILVPFGNNQEFERILATLRRNAA